MAPKGKPGRQFDYSLETVLKVRGIKEQKEQEKFAEKQQTYLWEKQKEEKIKEEKKDRAEELKSLMDKGKLIKDFSKVLSRRAHLGVLKEKLDKQIGKVIEASSKLEDQREQLLSAMKDRKIIEKDKERKLVQYNEVMKQLEIKFMDEISSLRHKHEKRERER